jgi:CheY-like chemotaxis protein
MAKRLAVINDDPLFLDLMDALLAQEGYDVACYASGTKAYEPLPAGPLTRFFSTYAWSARTPA